MCSIAFAHFLHNKALIYWNPSCNIAVNMSACTTDPKDVDVVEVRRYAIKYTPPTIVIEYKKNNKLYIKKIKLNISAKSDAKRIVHKLIKQNSDLLHHDKICKEQVSGF